MKITDCDEKEYVYDQYVSDIQMSVTLDHASFLPFHYKSRQRVNTEMLLIFMIPIGLI